MKEQEMTMEEFASLYEAEGGIYEIETPDGWQTLGSVVTKKKNCFKIVLENGMELGASWDHLCKSNGKWKNIQDLNIGDSLETKDGNFKIISKDNIGSNKTFDLEVKHTNHSYYSNGIVSHNTGKTALAEGLALMLTGQMDKEVPFKLRNKRIVTLDLAGMVAGTKYRGQFEERIKKVVEECKKDSNIILFIDEIHTLVGSGGAEGAMDGANIIKPSLSKGELQVIGATTNEEYSKNFEKDGALNRRFQPVRANEPTKEETVEILKGLRSEYERYHKVTYSDDVVSLMVDLADKYVTDKYFPDKAIDVLDEVGAKLSLKDSGDNKKIIEAQVKHDTLELKLEESIADQDFEQAATLRDSIKKAKAELDKVIDKNTTLQEVTEDMVRESIELITGIPVNRISSDSQDAKRLLGMENELNQKIINQGQATKVISNVIKRTKSGVRNPNKPASFMFVGPTGVGKTYISKQLADFMFGDPSKLIYIDCAELTSPTDVNKLIGATAGYVGYEDPAKFEKVRKNPYSIVLLDECEKAHKEIFNIFLRILEEGEIEDSRQRKINFRNCVIIMTSNIGSDLFSTKKSISFSQDHNTDDMESTKMKVKAAVKREFKPEFINRLDEIVVFNPLLKEDLMKIVEIDLQELKNRVLANGITLDIKASAINYIVSKADDESKGAMGARPLKRAISDYFEGELSDFILEHGETLKKVTITANKQGELNFRPLHKRTKK